MIQIFVGSFLVSTLFGCMFNVLKPDMTDYQRISTAVMTFLMVACLAFA